MSVRHPVEGRCLGVLDRGLDELPDLGALLAGQQAEREARPFGNEAVGDGGGFNGDGKVFRLHGDLHRPVDRHEVAPVAGSAAEDVEAHRELPEKAPAHPIVGIMLNARREGSNGDTGRSHHGST
jgi:hypothetical protein